LKQRGKSPRTGEGSRAKNPSDKATLPRLIVLSGAGTFRADLPYLPHRSLQCLQTCLT
jgi:hypothetical protein